MKLKQNIVRYNTKQQRLLRIAAKIHGFNTVSSFMKSITLEKAKGTSAKINSMIKKIEKKMQRIEDREGSKSAAFTTSEYQELTSELSILNQILRDYNRELNKTISPMLEAKTLQRNLAAIASAE